MRLANDIAEDRQDAVSRVEIRRHGHEKAM